MTTLICPECRHENESERIYCHSCGARLDRSAVAPRTEPAEDTHRRLKRLFDPQRVKLRQFFFRISKLLLGACAAATLILMILPPDVPAPLKTDLLASQIRFDLESAATRHQPAQLQYTDDQVNAYLFYTLRTKQSSLKKPLLDFKRAFVGFQEGMCNVTVERSLFGYPLYSSCGFAMTLAQGKIVASDKAGSIGRLAIHPQLMQFIDVIFADLRSALEQERKLIAKLGGIEFHQHMVVLTAAASQ